MATQQQQQEQRGNGRPLPKFGEWDVNDPASAEGFTVIFNKARDEKKTGGISKSGAAALPPKYADLQSHQSNYVKKSKWWFCCG